MLVAGLYHGAVAGQVVLTGLCVRCCRFVAIVVAVVVGSVDVAGLYVFCGRV